MCVECGDCPGQSVSQSWILKRPGGPGLLEVRAHSLCRLLRVPCHRISPSHRVSLHGIHVAPSPPRESQGRCGGGRVASRERAPGWICLMVIHSFIHLLVRRLLREATVLLFSCPVASLLRSTGRPRSPLHRETTQKLPTPPRHTPTSRPSSSRSLICSRTPPRTRYAQIQY